MGTPPALLIESKHLHEALAHQHGQTQREVWLRTLGLPEVFIAEWSPENEAVLVEAILAERHATNRGKIHKLLAQGSRIFASIVKQQTESSP